MLTLDDCIMSEEKHMHCKGLQVRSKHHHLAEWLCVCDATTQDSSASASRMDQTGSARSYPTSTTARCRKRREGTRAGKGTNKNRERTGGKQDERGKEGRKQGPRRGERKPGRSGKEPEKENREGLERNLRKKTRKDWKGT
eukprot:365375-Chlamydomonas_euryale.AAC.5